jgi:hypothetical protein
MPWRCFLLLVGVLAGCDSESATPIANDGRDVHLRCGGVLLTLAGDRSKVFVDFDEYPAVKDLHHMWVAEKSLSIGYSYQTLGTAYLDRMSLRLILVSRSQRARFGRKRIYAYRRNVAACAPVVRLL